jgi:hypothetical protein
MKKVRIAISAIIVLVCCGAIYLFAAPQKYVPSIFKALQPGHPMYLSMAYTYINPQEQDYRKTRTTLFYTYDIAKKQLKKVYAITVPSVYPVGIVDYKNSKVYYSIWGDLLTGDNKAGDQLESYDLNTHQTKSITGIHHEFDQIELFNNEIYAIAGGLESNGNMQLTRINPATGEIQPISPEDTDIEYNNFSIDYGTGEILTLFCSDFASRHMDTDQTTDVVTPCPYFLSTTNAKLDPPKVIYTFSKNPYVSLFSFEWGKNATERQEISNTANNLEVAAPCRLDDNNILFLGGTSVFSNDKKLKILHLNAKTIDDFVINGVKYYARPMVTPDRQGMFISLKMLNGTGGMYYYKFADKSLEYLFSIKDIEKDLPSAAVNSLTSTDVELVVQ